jgi:hypothetical protein
MSNRTVYSVSFIMLCLSLVALGYLSRKPFCISSKFVQSIDRVGKESSKSMPQCGSALRASYDENLKDYKNLIEDDLSELSSFFKWIGGVFPTIKINVLEYEQDIYRLQGNQLFISKSLLRQPRKVSRSLIRLWIQSQTQDRLTVGTLLNESLTDFLEYLIHGELVLTNDSQMQVVSDLSELRYWSRLPRFLMSPKDYCSSLWRMETDINFCKSTSESSGFAMHSLRPVVSQALISAFGQMNEFEKLAFYKKVTDFVSAQRLPSALVTQQESLALNRMQLLSALEHVRNSIKNAEFKLQANQNLAASVTSTLMDSALTKSEFVKIDLAVQVEKVSPKLAADLKSFAQTHKDIDVALITKEGIAVMPHLDLVPTSLWGPIAIAKKIWIQCGLVDSNKILANSKSVELLTAVDACEDESLDVISFLEGGVKKFAMSNREVSFMNVHVPSLEYSLSKNKQSPVELAKENLWKKLSIKNNPAWKEPIFDQVLNAYSIEAEISAIDLFRNSSLKKPTSAQ